MPESPSGKFDTIQQPKPAPRRRRQALLSVAAATVGVAVVATVGLLWFRRLLDEPVSQGNLEVTVTIVRGTPYRAIIENLRAARLLPHPFVFDYLAWRRGDAGRLRPGRYHLRSSMSVRRIYQTLLEGAPIRITVPEGWTLEQIAARLTAEGLLPDTERFLAAAHDPAFLAQWAITAPLAEGYVLPETYFFDPGATAQEILAAMIKAFFDEYADLKPPDDRKDWGLHQALTLASMIEREARNDAEKPVIASVYHNRLRRGMKLDCDATVRYALSKWREPLTASDLKTSSPYNTYLRAGLPPGPIACVGKASLVAALSPAKTDYLYYCMKDEQGHYFSRTLREHEQAVKKYLRKDLTNGGPKR